MTKAWWLIAGVGLFGFTSERSGADMQGPLRPRDVGRLVEVVLAGLRADTTLSAAWASREVVLDMERTLSAFGIAQRDRSIAAMELKVPTRAVSRAILSDCDQLGRGKCIGVGRAVYVAIKPDTLGDTAASVWADVFWADRGEMGRAAGRPATPATLSGFGVKVYLRRGPDGGWLFDRTGVAFVGD